MAVMKIRWSVAYGALVGLGIGVSLSAGLLFLGQDRFGTEAEEGAAILGFMIALPLSCILGICFDWGGYADQWKLFLTVAPPANWALLGAVAGLIAGLFKRYRQQVTERGEAANMARRQSRSPLSNSDSGTGAR